MKATSWIIAAVLAVLAIVFGVMWSGASKKTKGLEQKNTELQQLYDTSNATISEIQSSLDTFDKELMDSIGTASEIGGSTPAEIITNARAKIDEYKKKISELESRLASSKGQLSSIQAVVDKLKRSVADKEKIVAELEGRVSNLSQTLDTERQTAQTEINLRDSQIKDKETEIANQTREGNRLFFAVGTRKQLQESGIIERKGGLLGIGKVSTVKDADLSKFTEFNLLDTQEVTFPVTKKGYSILSSHIAASYDVSNAGDQYVLKVTDPESFRKQKLLVVELK
jgi:predicted RNase H-like nuclease (RuvC/YqgF family)